MGKISTIYYYKLICNKKNRQITTMNLMNKQDNIQQVMGMDLLQKRNNILFAFVALNTKNT